jgi:diguanylate cyclase (GGDEF)-like protein/PAS domain S-box-containing protein
MQKETILIVEDEKIIALDLLRRLEHFGYNVVGTAVDADEAYGLAVESRPSLILMDIMLAGPEDGVSAATRIRKDIGCAIIFLTAYADEATLTRARAAEPYGYVLKPFKERELFTAIDLALYKNEVEQRQRRQERLFSAILHSINDGIIATDTQLNIEFMNTVAEDITGWGEAEARGKPIADVATIKDDQSGRALFDPVFLSGGEFPFFFTEAHLTNRSGQDIEIDGSLTRIRQEGNSVEGFLLALRDITEIRHLSATVSYQASHDLLTGLDNRESFTRQLDLAIQSVATDRIEHTLLVVDIDHFKAVNDSCGSDAGDELLRQVSSCMRDLTSRNDTVSRLSGDEFGLVLRNCAQRDAVRVAERLQDALREHRFFWRGVVYPVSLSIGVVPLLPSINNTRLAIEAGDDACGLAREEGGNRVNVFHSQDLRYEKLRDEKEWISRITSAAEGDDFILYRQPITPIAASKNLRPKQEILLRLKKGSGVIASPGEFIPAAERYNLMRVIDRWVLARAMREIRWLIDAKNPIAESTFTLNLSGQSLLDSDLADVILNLCVVWNVPANLVCFEITETAAIQNLSYASRFIKTLKEKGFTFSLDDFGSGFSSFGYLQNLPVDYLKIDGSFVRDIDSNQVDFTMVESINSMGHVMGLKTVAEYVHNNEILEHVRRIGVDYAQGYVISEPVPLLPIGVVLEPLRA